MFLSWTALYIEKITPKLGNCYWKERFIKYGHAWLPDIFPIEEAFSINFYREQSVTPVYPTVSILRYPEWVAAAIISEAADEVVYGRELESCIKAKYIFNWYNRCPKK